MAEVFAALAPLTVQDYRELPEGGPRYQLVDGDLHMVPFPNVFHQEISGNIADLLRPFVKGRSLGKIFDAPLDVFLTETNVYQPDLLFVSTANLHFLKDDGVHGAPDLVIEILSPTTSRLDLGAKKHVYARCGVSEYWVVDPIKRTVSVYDLAKSVHSEATWSEGASFGCRFFPGLSLQVAAIFAR